MTDKTKAVEQGGNDPLGTHMAWISGKSSFLLAVLCSVLAVSALVPPRPDTLMYAWAILPGAVVYFGVRLYWKNGHWAYFFGSQLVLVLALIMIRTGFQHEEKEIGVLFFLRVTSIILVTFMSLVWIFRNTKRP